METYTALKLYNHLKYQRVLTWINPHLDLQYKNYINTQNLNVNLVHSIPISFEAPSLFSSTSNITITNSYQYLLSNWVNIDLYGDNPYCNDILNIKSYSMDVVLSTDNLFYDIKTVHFQILRLLFKNSTIIRTIIKC